jgi:O-antigen ligase
MARRVACWHAVSRGLAGLLTLFALLSPSWQGGLLFWWPLAVLHSGGRSYGAGALLLLAPLAALVEGLAAWWERGVTAPISDQGKEPIVGAHGHTPLRIRLSLPLAIFGAWVLLRSWPVQDRHVLIVAGVAVALFWGSALYTARWGGVRWVVMILAILLLVQGGVAVAQFAHQGPLGLAALGERAVLPGTQGASVIESLGQRWLRAYGLSPHPNALGGYLALGLLVVGGALGEGPRCMGARVGLALALLIGAGGLFVSFSRAAWLGAALGGGAWVWLARPWRRWPLPMMRRALLVALVLLAVVGAVLLVGYGDLLRTRLLRPGNPLEQTSLRERSEDIGQAWLLVHRAPLWGVGTGYYIRTLWMLLGDQFPEGFRLVHNIPLVVMAELGALGLVAWLGMMLAVPAAAWRARHRDGALSSQCAGLAAAWLAVLLISLFDNYWYLPVTWWPALYLGLLAGAGMSEASR